MPKFFVKNEQIKDNEITILGEDVKHIKNVLRLKLDDNIQICNLETSINYTCGISKINSDNIECIIFNERNIHIAMDYITSHFKDFINRDGFDISLLENKHLVELSKQIFDFKNEYNKQRTSKKTKRS